jgi:hypothetical protein
MSTEQQARALMIRHHQMVKNRQQSMLGRSAAEIGMETEIGEYSGNTQGKPNPTFKISYDRSRASLS